MKIYVGITDQNWYNQLSASNCDEVNFWNPGGTPFKVLKENEMFLFKLHSPNNYIVGGGFFVRFSLLPPFLAWDAFGEKNGTKTYDELMKRLSKYRAANRIEENSSIGCTIITAPFWFEEKDWIPVSNWSGSIVRGKSYDTENEDGKMLFEQVCSRLQRASSIPEIDVAQGARYAESITKHRLGQGAFRVIVTEAYQRRCAITGEKTLPVLEAAHIKPYGQDGPHSVNNGILLKSDFHTLYDKGYITIDPSLHIEVSHRLHEDFGNGKDYYKYQGQKIMIIPENEKQLPEKSFLQWHNEHVFLG